MRWPWRLNEDGEAEPVVALVASCARGPKLHPVSGTVSYAGKPVPAGQIFFDPDVSKGHDGPQAVAMIKDGKLDTSAGARGVPGGPTIVRIDAFDGRPGAELPLGRPLFVGHEEKRELPAGAAERSFDVPARKAR